MASDRLVTELARLKVLMIHGWHMIATIDGTAKDIALTPPDVVVNPAEVYDVDGNTFQRSYNYVELTRHMNDLDFIALINEYANL